MIVPPADYEKLLPIASCMSRNGKVTEHLVKALWNLTYNVSQVIALYSTTKGRSTVTKAQLEEIDKFLETECKNLRSRRAKLSPQRGGASTSLPSEYFGGDSGRYTLETPGADLLTFNPDDPEASIRPEFTPGSGLFVQSGGASAPALSPAHAKIMANLAVQIVHSSANVKVTSGKKVIASIFERNVGCLYKSWKPKTEIGLKKVLKKEQFLIFQ